MMGDGAGDFWEWVALGRRAVTRSSRASIRGTMMDVGRFVYWTSFLPMWLLGCDDSMPKGATFQKSSSGGIKPRRLSVMGDDHVSSVMCLRC